MGWLVNYRAATPGVRVADNTTVRLDLDNEPQPDACVLIDPGKGGQAKLSPENYIEGSPELVVEVAASSVSIDLNQKLNAYRRNGVREYIVFRTYDGEVDWFVLSEGRFVRVQPDGLGIFRSLVFPGLWLKADALIAGDIATVLATLLLGIASPEHEHFVKQLSGAAQK
jgi:Uma2 family endonuclease